MQVTDASISNIDAFLSAIYPNPSTGLFDIEYQATNGTHFWIKDAQGRCIQEGIFEGQQAQVNIQSCAAGIYYLQTEQHASTYRLVKY
jgi:hypothetical protein